MAGLIDERPGRRGPLKLNDEILAYLQQAPRSMSGAALAAEVEARFGVSLHRRTLERAKRPRSASGGRPSRRLRGLEPCEKPRCAARRWWVRPARFERAGLAALIIRPLALPVFSAVITGAARPPWSPYADPRSEAIIDVYRLLLAAESGVAEEATS